MEAICNVDVCVWKRVSEIQLPQPYERPGWFRLAPQDPCSVLLEPTHPSWRGCGVRPASKLQLQGGRRSLSKCYIQDVVCLAQHVDELSTWADRL